MTDDNDSGNKGESNFNYEAWKILQDSRNYKLPEDNFATKMFNRIYNPCKSLPLTTTEVIKRTLEDL